MNNAGSSLTAHRTCAQCKSSKKKCDKLLPKCSRCRRLSIECAFEDDKADGLDSSHDTNNAKFDEIFRRLERLEGRITTPGGPLDVRSQSPLEAPHTDGHEAHTGPHKWSVDPGHLKTEYIGFILMGSAYRVLSENKTTVEAIAHIYFTHTHPWLPMVSLDQFRKGLQKFKDFEPEDGFLLLLLAMHLVVTPPSDHPPGKSLSESPWYRACKYYFAHYVSLSEPSIQYLQAGILISLFEHYQCIEDRALVTLGICARLAYALELDDIAAQGLDGNANEISPGVEEATHTWFAIVLLDRYLNMSPLEIPQHPVVYQEIFQTSFLHVNTVKSPIFAKPDREDLEFGLFELEASRMLAQVQSVIRGNRRRDIPTLADVAPTITQHVDELLTCLRIKQKNSGTFSGILVSLSAVLQLHTWYVRRKGVLDQEIMVAILSYVEQIKATVSQCKVINGFTENYMDGFQPSWISAAFAAMMAYKLVRTARPHDEFDFDTGPLMELLNTSAPRYKLAEQCLDIIYTTYCQTSTEEQHTPTT